MSRYISNEELNDNIIISDLKKAVFLYEDGGIVEAMSILQEILNSVNGWMKESEEVNK